MGPVSSVREGCSVLVEEHDCFLSVILAGRSGILCAPWTGRWDLSVPDAADDSATPRAPQPYRMVLSRRAGRVVVLPGIGSNAYPWCDERALSTSGEELAWVILLEC